MASIPLLTKAADGRIDETDDDEFKDDEAELELRSSSSSARPSLRHSITRLAPNWSLALVCVALLLVGAGLQAAVSSIHARYTTPERAVPVVEVEDPFSSTRNLTSLDRTKVAAIIEKRNLPELIPVLLDFIVKVPEEWPFELWTSSATAQAVADSRLLAPHVKSGKLKLKQMPDDGATVNDGKTLSAFLTAPWWWEQLAPAEHILFFQSDSLLCSKSEFTVNDFLGVNITSTNGGYAWVGAPWDLRGYPAEPWGGNGGLSIRRRSIMLELTRTYEWDGPSEDLWFTNKINEHYNGTHLFPDQHTGMRFSWEGLPEAAMNLGDWPYEPLGIHTGTGWAACAKRGWDRIHKILDHCPEAKLVMPSHCLVDAARPPQSRPDLAR